MGAVFFLGILGAIALLTIFAFSKNGKNKKDALKILIAIGVYVFVVLGIYYL
jgi:Kef-type K+ transport system membrane component KefB